jgi:hypothetical protein
MLDLRSTVTEVATSPTSRPDMQMPDQPSVLKQELLTTVELPNGKAALVGGITMEPASHTDPPRDLYLVIRVDSDK